MATQGSRLLPVFYTLLFTLVPVVFAGNHSFWIDEALTWNVARLGSLHEVLAGIHAAATAGSSNAQMPGYLVYAWAWAQVGGFSETWSRWSNLPWLIILGWAWWHLAALLSWPGWRERSVFLSLPLISPFVVWYSLEYRPYAALISMGAVAVCGLVMALTGDSRGRWITLISVVAAAYLHMLALILIPCILAVVLILGRGHLRNALGRWRPQLAVGALLLAPIAFYYAYTLTLGARAPAFGASAKNLTFIIYEYLGFGGLGPSRHELHFGGQVEAFVTWLPSLALLSVPGLVLVARGARELVTAEKEQISSAGRAILWIGATVGGGGVMLLWIAALPAEFRILGRHVAVLFPAFLGALGVLVLSPRIERWWQWAMVVLLLAALGLSSARLVGTDYHARDDYRTAVRLVRERQEPGQLTIVLANVDAYRYYDASVDDFASSLEDLTEHGVLGRSRIILESPSQAEWDALLRYWSGPLLIVLGKPYFYDSHGVVREWLKNHDPGELIGAPATFELWKVIRVPEVAAEL